MVSFMRCCCVLLVLGICFGVGPVGAEGIARQTVDFTKSGVRFEIKALVRADDSPTTNRQAFDKAVATVSVRLRISAHATGSDFFGEVTQTFPGFPVFDGSPELRVWGEERCHQRRGLPKVTVVAIDGAVLKDQQRMTVASRPRRLGVKLPADEISQGIPLSLLNQNGAAAAFRSRSKTSRLAVDVRIYAFDCDLQARQPLSVR